MILRLRVAICAALATTITVLSAGAVDTPALVKCQYSSTPPTAEDGKIVAVQCDEHGQVKTTASVNVGDISVGEVAQGTPAAVGNAWPVKLIQGGAANAVGNPIFVSPGTGATWAVTGTFWQATQPISAASLPLPTGAALDASLGTINTTLGTTNTDLGPPGAASCATDTGSCSLNALTQRLAQRLTTINTTLASPFQAGGSIGNTAFGSTQSGNWSVRLQDGSGNAITSATRGSERPLAVQIIDASGNQITSFGGSGGTASNFGSAFPSSGTAAGWSDGTNMQGPRVFDGDTGGGTQYLAGVMLRSSGSGGSVETGIAATPLQVSLANTAANSTAVKVDGSAVTQPVSGTVTANAGTNLNTSSLALESGGNLATLAGGVTSNVYQINTKQVNGVTTLAGAGAAGTGSQRVAVGQDTTTIAGAAPGAAGTASSNVLTVQGIASMTKLLVTPDSVALPANQSVNVSQIGGTNTVTAGVSGAAAIGGNQATNNNVSTNVNPVLVAGSDYAGTPKIQNWKVDATGIGFINCSNCSGSGVSQTDEGAFTAGTSLFASGGGFFQTTATSNALTNGQFGSFQLTANRALFSNLRNASGTEVGTASTPLQVSLANTAANATAVKIDGSAVTQPVSGTVTANAGTNLNTSLLALEGGGNLATLAGGVTSSVYQHNTKQVNGVTTLAGAGAVGTGAQRVAVGQDTTTVAGSAPGTAGTASTNVVTVQGIASMTKLLVTPDANSSVNLGQVGGSSVATAATGIAKVGVTDGTGNAITSTSNALDVNLKTGGTLVQGSTTSGQGGSLIMGAVTTSAPSYTTAQTSPVSLTTAGAIRMTDTNLPTTVDTNSGNKSASTIRTVQATDQPAVAGLGAGATGAAPPANAIYGGVSASGNLTGMVGCDSHVFKHITTATDTLAIQGISAKTIKICGVLAAFAGTATVYLENTASTNANCSSTLTQITGLWSGVAQSVMGFNGAFWNGLANTNGNGLCINSTGTGGVDVDIWYTQGS